MNNQQIKQELQKIVNEYNKVNLQLTDKAKELLRNVFPGEGYECHSTNCLIKYDGLSIENVRTIISDLDYQDKARENDRKTDFIRNMQLERNKYDSNHPYATSNQNLE